MNNSNVETATPTNIHSGIKNSLQTSHRQDAFKFTLRTPFSSPDKPKAKFLIDGLLKEGGLAALVAKPKHSKSSISRYAAVCIAKGEPFLGLRTVRGEVLLITIEDSIEHVENCLNVLGWNQSTDEPIHLIETVAADTEENLNALREVLNQHPGIKLVVIDTFAKLGRVRDMNEYAPWLKVFDGLKRLRAEFPYVSFLCLLHAKKTNGDDRFDSMLGSSALRGEFDSNIAIYQEGGKRIITTECRMGKPLAPTILGAVVVESDGCDIVKNFFLGQRFDAWSDEQKSRAAKKRKASLEERIITYVSEQPNERAIYKFVLEDVEGKNTKIIEALSNLIQQGILTESGVKGSPMDPYTVALDRNALQMHDFVARYSNKEEANGNNTKHD